MPEAAGAPRPLSSSHWLWTVQCSLSQVVRGARLCVGVRALFEGTLLAVGSLQSLRKMVRLSWASQRSQSHKRCGAEPGAANGAIVGRSPVLRPWHRGGGGR